MIKKYGEKVAKSLVIRKKFKHFQFGSTIYYDIWRISQFLKEKKNFASDFVVKKCKKFTDI